MRGLSQEKQLVRGFKLFADRGPRTSTEKTRPVNVNHILRLFKIVLTSPRDNMALLTEAMSVVKPFDRENEVEDLSDEQIEQLLQQATVRLREQQAIKLESRYVPAIPAAGKLMVSSLGKPYIQTTGDIAKADTSRLVDEQHRQLADGAIRKVEDPVVVKQKNLEVRHSHL